MCNVHFILTLTPPWLQVKVTRYFNFVNYFSWRVAVCVRFSSETTRPISPMMIPINSGNNVDVQHALHFDLHPSMTAGQGHKILQFCEFRLLPWHECWYMSGPYKVAGDRLDLVIITTYYSQTSSVSKNILCILCHNFGPHENTIMSFGYVKQEVLSRQM